MEIERIKDALKTHRKMTWLIAVPPGMLFVISLLMAWICKDFPKAIAYGTALIMLTVLLSNLAYHYHNYIEPTKLLLKVKPEICRIEDIVLLISPIAEHGQNRSVDCKPYLVLRSLKKGTLYFAHSHIPFFPYKYRVWKNAKEYEDEFSFEVNAEHTGRKVQCGDLTKLYVTGVEENAIEVSRKRNRIVIAGQKMGYLHKNRSFDMKLLEQAVIYQGVTIGN